MTRCIRRNRSKARLRAVVVAVGIALAALLVPAAAGAAGPWVDGKADQDTIENCLTGKPAVGVMGGIAWRSQADHVPYVGRPSLCEPPLRWSGCRVRGRSRCWRNSWRHWMWSMATRTNIRCGGGSGSLVNRRTCGLGAWPTTRVQTEECCYCGRATNHSS